MSDNNFQLEDGPDIRCDEDPNSAIGIRAASLSKLFEVFSLSFLKGEKKGSL